MKNCQVRGCINKAYYFLYQVFPDKIEAGEEPQHALIVPLCSLHGEEYSNSGCTDVQLREIIDR